MPCPPPFSTTVCDGKDRRLHARQDLQDSHEWVGSMTNIAFHPVILPFFLLLLSGISSTSASDWPQWRGPNRDNVWNETHILQTFPTEGPKVRWRTPVGPGWSSPVVARGHVYLTDMRL